MYSHDSRLINHIATGSHKILKSMLNSNLAKASDKYGTLLHYAATLGNAVIAKHLISIGSPIDLPGINGKTPLMLAVEQENSEIVRFLLRSGANIDIADDEGQTALRMAFRSRYIHYKIIQAFFHRVRTDATNEDELIKKLVKAGYKLHHAVRARDVEILKGLLQLGTNINSRDHRGETILHLAALVGNFESVKLLIDNGANVNLVNFFEKSPLTFAARARNPAIVQLLLERGAYPNPTGSELTSEPLYALFSSDRTSDKDKIRKCAEILLQHDSFPRNLGTFLNFFLELNAGIYRSFNYLNCVVAHLAMVEMINSSTESIMHCEDVEDHNNMLKLRKYYNECEQILKIDVFGATSLLALLAANESKMRVYLRNEIFVSEFDHFCLDHEMKECFPYYYNILIKRITKATRLVKLETKAISAICNLIDLEYNQSYIFARQVISYLSEHDLEQLCQV